MSFPESSTDYLENVAIRQILRNDPTFFLNDINARKAENILIQLSGATGWNKVTDFSFINFLLEKMPINEFSLFPIKPGKGITVLRGQEKLYLYDIVYPTFKESYLYGNLSSKENIYDNIFNAAFTNGFSAFDNKGKKTELEFSQERLPYFESFSDKFFHIYKNIDKFNPEFLNDYSMLVKLFYNYNEHYLNILSINREIIDKTDQHLLNSTLIKKDILASFVKEKTNIISPYLEKKIKLFSHKVDVECIKFEKALLNVLTNSVNPLLNNTPRL